VPHRGHHGERDRSLVQAAARRGPPDPSASAHGGVPGDGLCPLPRAARVQPCDLLGEALPQFDILAGASLPVAFAAAHPDILVVQALLLGRIQRGFLDQQPLPLVPLARPAPPDHHGRQPAALLGPPGERRVPGRKEHQVVHVGAGQAQRPFVVHDEQAAGAVALRAGPVLDRHDHDQVRRGGLSLRYAFPLPVRKVRGEPLNVPGLFLLRTPVPGESQPPAIPGGRDVLGFARLEPLGPRPALEVLGDLREPVVTHGQEAFQAVHPPQPPVGHVPGVQPAEPDAHIDRRHVALLLQRLLGSGDHPALKPLLRHEQRVVRPTAASPDLVRSGALRWRP